MRVSGTGKDYAQLGNTKVEKQRKKQTKKELRRNVRKTFLDC